MDVVREDNWDEIYTHKKDFQAIPDMHDCSCDCMAVSLIAVVASPTSSSSFSPLQLQALVPAPEDSHDSIATEDDQIKASRGEAPLIESRQVDVQVGESPPESMDTGGEGGSQTEAYENPFLKPPKKIKLKFLSHQQIHKYYYCIHVS